MAVDNQEPSENIIIDEKGNKVEVAGEESEISTLGLVIVALSAAVIMSLSAYIVRFFYKEMNSK